MPTAAYVPLLYYCCSIKLIKAVALQFKVNASIFSITRKIINNLGFIIIIIIIIIIIVKFRAIPHFMSF